MLTHRPIISARARQGYARITMPGASCFRGAADARTVVPVDRFRLVPTTILVHTDTH